MNVRVRLFGYLAKHCRRDPFEEFEFPLQEDSKGEDLLGLLGIPEGEIMMVINPGEKEEVLIINRVQGALAKTKVKADDRVWIYPFLDGG